MISAVPSANVHAEDTLRITPIILADLNAIRRSMNAGLAEVGRPPLTIAQTEAFTNYAEATDLLDALEKINGMAYTASEARARLLRLYTLSSTLEAERACMLASVRS